jgi:hypothetical protein
MPILVLGVELNRVLHFIILAREQNRIEQALPEINNSEKSPNPTYPWHKSQIKTPRVSINNG